MTLLFAIMDALEARLERWGAALDRRTWAYRRRNPDWVAHVLLFVVWVWMLGQVFGGR